MPKEPEVLLPLREVERRTGYGHSTIYEMIAEGSFPRQVKVGPQGVRWLEREITEWIQARLDARDEKANQQKQRPKPKPTPKPKKRPAQ